MRIADVYIDEMRREGAATIRMLERVPAEKADWKPHTKSMPLGQLAFHIATVPHRVCEMLRAGDFDVLKAGPPVPTGNAYVDDYRRNLDELVELVGSMDNDAMKEPFTLRKGDKIIFQFPNAGLIRSIAMNHSYHHRGQLSVYLRLLDVPVPATYGTSADEPA